MTIQVLQPGGSPDGLFFEKASAGRFQTACGKGYYGPETGRGSRIAIDARLRFGRGILNLGDCFAYALAKTHGDGVLLYKGEDFPRTDIVSALPAPAA